MGKEGKWYVFPSQFSLISEILTEVSAKYAVILQVRSSLIIYISKRNFTNELVDKNF